MTLTPAQRRLQAQVAAHARWSKSDPIEGTAAARAKFLERFIEEVDPEGELPEKERLRRAESARRSYFARLALRSSQARAERKKAS